MKQRRTETPMALLTFLSALERFSTCGPRTSSDPLPSAWWFENKY